MQGTFRSQMRAYQEGLALDTASGGSEHHENYLFDIDIKFDENGKLVK